MVLMDFLEVNNIWMSNRDDWIRVASSCHRRNGIPEHIYWFSFSHIPWRNAWNRIPSAYVQVLKKYNLQLLGKCSYKQHEAVLRQQTCSCSDQYSYLKTKSPAQYKDLMRSNTDEGMLLSHKILVGPQSHSKVPFPSLRE